MELVGVFRRREGEDGVVKIFFVRSDARGLTGVANSSIS